MFLICYAELLSFEGIGLTHFPYNIKEEGSCHPNNKLLTGAPEYSTYIWVKDNFGLCLFTCPIPRTWLGCVGGALCGAQGGV